MTWLEIFLRSILIGPVIMFMLTIFIPAALGKTIGFRELYVKLLIYVFEYGRRRIEKARKKKDDAAHLNHIEEESSEDESSAASTSAEEEGRIPTGSKSVSEAIDAAVPGGSPKLARHASFPVATNTTLSPASLANSMKEKKEAISAPVSTIDLPKTLKLKRMVSCPAVDIPSSILQETKRRLSISEDEAVLELLSVPRSLFSPKDTISEERTDFLLSDIFEFVASGIEVIVNDQVTQRFETEELKSWNLLTRTNRRYEFISFRLSCLWLIGCIIRYWILLPIRVFFFVLSLTVFLLLTFLVGLIPNSYACKKQIHDLTTRYCFRLFSRCFSLIATYHQTDNKPEAGGICVANHTSIIDVIPLGCETSFALVGQNHGGFLGFLQSVLKKAADHIFFERTEAKDREAVSRRLREHVEDKSKLPILIFPEGTCINNSAVMQFKKGSFEIGGTVYPVAIKYDPRFGDAFWNSNQTTMLHHLYMMMTSWAIVCDIWYLPPMRRLEGESAIDFANRVKAAIARRGGLVDLDWDGQLKRFPAKREWKEKEQLKYSQKLVKSNSRSKK